MIWILREDGEIYFYTSDNKKFKTMKDATNYVASNLDILDNKNNNFNLLYERKKKINVILSKILY